MHRTRTAVVFAALALLGLMACTGTAPVASTAPSSAPSVAPSTVATVPATASASLVTATLTPAVTIPVVAASASAVLASPTVPPKPSTAPSPSGSGGTVTPNVIDPCKLLTTQQASDVNKIKYPPGVVHSFRNGTGVECVWRTPGASVVVQVLIAPDAGDAAAAYAEAEAMAMGFNVTDVPNFADKAAIARAPAGLGATTGGIYVREGTTFFDIVYLNGTPPTDDQLKFAATLVLGHLP
jgi:hypothetical protein